MRSITNQIVMFMYSCFCFSLLDFSQNTLSKITLINSFYPPPPLMTYAIHGNTGRFFCPGSLTSSFLFLFYLKVYFLCCKVLWVLTNTWHRLQLQRHNSSITVKLSYASPSQIFSLYKPMATTDPFSSLYVCLLQNLI